MKILSGLYELVFTNGKRVKLRLRHSEAMRYLDALWEGETITVEDKELVLTSIELLQ